MKELPPLGTLESGDVVALGDKAVTGMAVPALPADPEEFFPTSAAPSLSIVLTPQVPLHPPSAPGKGGPAVPSCVRDTAPGVAAAGRGQRGRAPGGSGHSSPFPRATRPQGPAGTGGLPRPESAPSPALVAVL